MGRCRRRRRSDGALHGFAAGQGGLFGARSRITSCRGWYDGWQHGEGELAPGDDAVTDLPPTGRGDGCAVRRGKPRGALSWVNRYADDHGVARQERAAFTYATTESGQQSAERELLVAESHGLPLSWVETG